MQKDACAMTDEAGEIRKFIIENFLFSKSDAALSDSQSLIESGILDSTGVIELIMFVEETFRIEVGEEDMIPDNFDSIDRIVEFVRRSRSNETRSDSPAA
jgi:acyl carrier protein